MRKAQRCFSIPDTSTLHLARRKDSGFPAHPTSSEGSQRGILRGNHSLLGGETRLRAPHPCGLGAQHGGEGGQKGRRSFPSGVPGKPRKGTGGAQPPDEEEEGTRRPLTGGSGAGDDEAGGLAEPLRHGGAGRRGRRPSPHAAQPRMRRGSRRGGATVRGAAMSGPRRLLNLPPAAPAPCGGRSLCFPS